MTRLERQLLSLLDALREHSSAGSVDRIRRALVSLADQAEQLDPTDPYHRGIGQLYDYVDATTRAAVTDPAAWIAGRRADIENSLSSVLAATRRGGTVYTVSCLREDLTHLTRHIDQLSEPEREPLRQLLGYVQMKTHRAMEQAVHSDWGIAPIRRPARTPVGATVIDRPGP
ncbi:hypothetical protein [Nocardia sp. NPDC051570]|uniref:hypothetical protein n=1 Tax=Nocardia sp. NPDC051570 TaxID=3364324 RepID=UPI0037ABB9A5